MTKSGTTRAKASSSTGPAARRSFETKETSGSRTSPVGSRKPVLDPKDDAEVGALDQFPELVAQPRIPASVSHSLRWSHDDPSLDQLVVIQVVGRTLLHPLEELVGAQRLVGSEGQLRIHD